MVKIEEMDKGKVKLEITIDQDVFEEGMQKAYLKLARKVNIPGFRKGKATRKVIEKYYGEQLFYDEAVNFVCPAAYDKAIEENDLQPVSVPEMDVVQIGSGQDLIFTAEFFAKPKFELCEYKGLNVPKSNIKVTDEHVEFELAKLRQKNARLVSVDDREAALGDSVLIDFVGSVDGVEFEGGRAEDQMLKLGSGQFIPGFEEQLLGKKAGDQVLVRVTFPENYHSTELAGKQAEFFVTIKDVKIQELPDLDDEFAQDVSENDTLDQLRDEIREMLDKAVKEQEETENQDNLLMVLGNKVEMELPECMVDEQEKGIMQDMIHRINMQGMDMDSYLAATGQTIDDVKSQIREQAKASVKNSLIIEAIAKKEDIVVNDEDREEEISEIMKETRMSEARVREYAERNPSVIDSNIITRKTMEFLQQHAIYEQNKEE